ncbi:MAG: hypothetical protein H6533_01705 [Thermoleophilales bacterium]|nr:hypothetical protein [Thermoleophilales bacterium]
MTKSEAKQWSLIDQRIREAAAALEQRSPSWVPVVGLQVAAEVYVEVRWREASWGRMKRSQSPHLDRLNAANALAMGGRVSEDLPVLVRDLQRLARDRYEIGELYPASVEYLIRRTEVALAKRAISTKAAAPQETG